MPDVITNPNIQTSDMVERRNLEAIMLAAVIEAAKSKIRPPGDYYPTMIRAILRNDAEHGTKLWSN